MQVMMSMLFFPSQAHLLKIMLLSKGRGGGDTVSSNHHALTVSTAWAVGIFQTPMCSLQLKPYSDDSGLRFRV